MMQRTASLWTYMKNNIYNNGKCSLNVKIKRFVNLCFKDYIDAHPETIILDPLPAIRTLLDRCKSYQLIHRLESCMRGKVLSVTS